MLTSERLQPAQAPFARDMFCFSCATADASGGEEWNPTMVRQLYKQSLKANNGRLIVHGVQPKRHCLLRDITNHHVLSRAT